MNLNNLSTDRTEGAVMALKFEIPAEETAKGYKKAVNSYAGNASIPGFRKGKAPAKMVEERFRAQILDLAEERVLSEAIWEAIRQAGLKDEDLLTRPSVSNKSDFSPDAAMKIEARIDFIPALDAQGYKAVKLALKPSEVTPEEIEGELKRIAQEHSFFAPVDRAAATGDSVIMDFEGKLEDGTPITETPTQNYQAVLGSNRLIPGFEDGLVGVKPGEKRTLNLRFPDDYPKENFRGKNSTIDITVTAVKERRMPEIDDELAKDVESENLDELKKRISQFFNEQKSHENREELEADLLDQLRKANPLEELPAVMVEAEMQRRREGFDRMVKNMRLTPEKYFELSKQTPDQLEANMLQAARDTVHSSLVLRAVARAEKIGVSNDELSYSIAYMAAQREMSPEVLARQIAEEGRIDLVKFDILKRKALQFIIEHAEIEGSADEVAQIKGKSPAQQS
ncbi:MAG: trigger factor [Candidatus Hydrogenedentota bacterium]